MLEESADNPIAQLVDVMMRSAAATIVSDTILPALRNLGVLADVIEVSAGVLHVTIDLRGAGIAAADAAPTPPTFRTMPPGEAAALWHLSGGIDAI